MADASIWAECPLLERNPERVSGAWVFRGTRVPVAAVLENLKDMSVDEVAESFPSVDADRLRDLLDFLAARAAVV